MVNNMVKEDTVEITFLKEKENGMMEKEFNG